ncbi:unnamed protein product [Sphagnum jensenii]|uniref:Pectinesterase n=1 Tax=Sphagnum jensenii TaxID=128206 RepID=A0ABP1AJF4_9BRYO
MSRPRPIYLVDYACYLPQESLKQKILERSGLGDETYLPSAMHALPPCPNMKFAREEAEEVMFGCLDELFEKTKVKPKDIGVLVVNCSLFNPTPSLSAMIVNKYKMRGNIRTFNLGGMGCSAGVISIDLAKDILQVHGGTYAIVSALSSCLLVLQGSQDLLEASLHPLSNLDPSTFEQQITDSLTWVSAALTFHTTCLDSYEGVYGSATKDSLLSEAQGVTSVLADAVSDGFPEWMGREDRRILKTSSTTNLTLVNALVAKDGSGQYHTVQAAINAAPQNSASKWTIRVKAGLYNEIVTIPSTATNLVLMGDGAGQTVITGNLSVGGSNVTTYLSATVSSLAANVIIRDMTIRNTAGAKNFQAVALKVVGDQTAVWRCSLEGYQDTLYALSQRQFYKSCTIYGTVDFIFGNAAAVFQTCTLLARAPIPGQQNTFTAQGRTIQAQNTGFSFQNCTIDAAPELKAAQSAGQFVASYLGRPWKLYSRTVYLQNSMSSVINPAGWLPWNGSFALSTLFYGEYKNTGPGAAAGQRVSWSTQITSSKVATQYTVDNFISGALWLPQTTIDFFPQLISTSTGKKVTKPVKPKPKS